VLEEGFALARPLLHAFARVPRGRFELPIPCGNSVLNAARLPVSPPGLKSIIAKKRRLSNGETKGGNNSLKIQYVDQSAG
jgi:hypothetical protein